MKDVSLTKYFKTKSLTCKINENIYIALKDEKTLKSYLNHNLKKY